MFCRAAIWRQGLRLIALAAIAIWGFSGFFRVDPDELGIVLRFGKYVRDAKPGLNLPSALSDRVRAHPQGHARQPRRYRHAAVEASRRGTPNINVPEESLMLTGDENIVDVDFSVFWLIKPNGAGDYLFNIQQPEGTVKAVAESAMREVVGRSEISRFSPARGRPSRRRSRI